MAPKVTDAYKVEKRLALLHSALACFAEQGFQTTTVDDIVRHAGVSKGMLYTYFKSKEDMYLQLMQQRTDTFFAETAAAFHGCATAADKVRLLMQRFCDLPVSPDRRQNTTVHLEFFLYCTRHDQLARIMHDRYERFIQFLADVIEEGIRTGEFPATVDTRVTSALFWALRDGISLHFTQVGNQSDYGAMCAAAEHMVFQYLGQ